VKKSTPSKIIEYNGFNDEKGVEVSISKKVNKVKLRDKISTKEIQELLVKALTRS